MELIYSPSLLFLLAFVDSLHSAPTVQQYYGDTKTAFIPSITIPLVRAQYLTLYLFFVFCDLADTMTVTDWTGVNQLPVSGILCKEYKGSPKFP